MLRYVPLTLTCLRFGLGPLFLWMHARGQGRPMWIWAMIALVLVSMLTDWLDGKLARRWNVVSTLGKLLDPFADALFCMIVFISFARQSPPLMWPWVVWVLVIREAAVTFVVRPLALWKRIVMAAGWLGKIKTGLQFYTIFLVLLLLLVDSYGLERWLGWMAWLKAPSFIAIAFFSVAAFSKYVVDLARALMGAATAGNMVRLGKEAR